MTKGGALAGGNGERRLTPRGSQRRAQILEQSAQLFAEKGYHQTSVADIVDACKVGKGVFYWYFESKELLFIEIIKELQLALRRHQAREIAAASDPIGRLELGVRATMQWHSRNRHVFSLFHQASADAGFAYLVSDGAEVALADTMRHINDGIALGQLPDANPRLLAIAIAGVALSLAREVEGGADPDELEQAATAFILRGLLGQAVPTSTPTSTRRAGR